MNVVLVLGGYGGFGARLSRRLSQDGWKVLVAGRNLAAARSMAAGLTGAEAVVADRNGDLAPVLRATQPDLLIDAAGPFQGSDYRVPEACIAHGVHYLDLADARAFVCGIGELDARARAAGVAVISGASSVPALSGAVAAELTRDFEAVRSVEIAISASHRATAGASVAAAILSSVGRPVRLRRGGRWETAFGWTEPRRETFAVAGRPALRRWTAIADAPDCEILPSRLPGAPACGFRAGPESALQLFALGLLARLVQGGLVGSLAGLAPWLRPLQRLTAGAGDGRSAMSVEAKGLGGGAPTVRRWTLIAEDGCGVEIPTLAAQALARSLRRGAVAAGARDAGGMLKLADFEPLLAGLAVTHETKSATYAPLYRRILGERFDRLPQPVRAMHEVVGDAGADGVAEVSGSATRRGRFVAALLRFPPAGRHLLHVTFVETNGAERWTRQFSEQSFSSVLSQSGGRLVERFGQLRFVFDLPSDADGLKMAMIGWSAFGVPMPRAFGPRTVASETARDGEFRFDVSIALPLVGKIVRYAGFLRRAEAPNPRSY